MQRPGGDGVVTPTERTEDQTIAGIYWGYDGTPDLGAPPRLYNQITMKIANRMDTGFVELARLLALVNVAMADAGIEICLGIHWSFDKTAGIVQGRQVAREVFRKHSDRLPETGSRHTRS